MFRRRSRPLVALAVVVGTCCGPAAAEEREALQRALVLTDTRVVDLDLDSGELLAEGTTDAAERFLTGDEGAVLLARGDGTVVRLGESLVEATSGEYSRAPEPALVAATVPGSDELIVATGARVERFSSAGQLVESREFPGQVTVVATDGAYLWAWGNGGGFRLDLGDFAAPPRRLDAGSSTVSRPLAACFDPLAGDPEQSQGTGDASDDD